MSCCHYFWYLFNDKILPVWILQIDLKCHWNHFSPDAIGIITYAGIAFLSHTAHLQLSVVYLAMITLDQGCSFVFMKACWVVLSRSTPQEAQDLPASEAHQMLLSLFVAKNTSASQETRKTVRSEVSQECRWYYLPRTSQYLHEIHVQLGSRPDISILVELTYCHRGSC